jgi:hypothetical protein
MVLVGGIVFSHFRKVFFKDMLVEGRLAHVYNVQWLAMLRLSWGSDLNAHPIKYFPIEDDYGCVPYAVDLPSKELR